MHSIDIRSSAEHPAANVRPHAANVRPHAAERALAAVRKAQCEQNGDSGACFSDRATNSSACISTSACLQWPTRRVGVPASAATATMNGRATMRSNRCNHKADPGGGVWSRTNRATDRSVSPSPFSYIASSHHPSIHGRFTESHIKTTVLLFMCVCACSYPSPTTTHLIACMFTGAGHVQGAGVGALADPTVCTEVSDESSGPVRSAMEPQ
ncbi:Bifunctional purine biosynthesis protein PurH [Dissostichus eleginoides]|uniref:Bifunctional purine biosynthesis protein PurH n=1 Tax=Dissostichus eleginoides TaxID=100907 RepID=A0AAD9EX44_DISEL|nr:Bifunctional purine biosynthesis protein PurH [Dissostichus eleginoides]